MKLKECKGCVDMECRIEIQKIKKIEYIRIKNLYI